jgi:RimJ/RimL family protein N-acetyltransferase
VILETERLLVREFVPEDAKALASFYGDPEVMRFIGSGATRSPEETARQIGVWQRLYREWGYGLWATAQRETGELVGRCGLLRWQVDDRTEIEVGYLIGRGFWGRGYGLEAARGIKEWAFERLDVSRVVSMIYPQNLPSIRVAEANGMRHLADIERDGRLILMYGVDRRQDSPRES